MKKLPISAVGGDEAGTTVDPYTVVHVANHLIDFEYLGKFPGWADEFSGGMCGKEAASL